MHLKSAYVAKNTDGSIGTVSLTVDVPLIGEVKISGGLSQETIRRIEAEALAALRTKLGQNLVSDEGVVNHD